MVKRLPSQASGSLGVGDPVRVFGPADPELPAAIKAAGFAKAAFGVTTDWEKRIQRYEEACEVRSAEFAAHAQDMILKTEPDPR